MTYRLIIIYVLLHNYFYGQRDSTDRRYYKDGRLKFVATWKGRDTIQFVKFYKNAQIKDSVWLYISDNKEIPFGTEKTYFKSGKLRSIYHYKKGHDEYVSYRFYENGVLRRFEQTPTGLLKTYNKKGKQTSEEDRHKSKNVVVSKNFRKGRHLKNTIYESKIVTKRAWLVDSRKKHRLTSGVLVSLNLTSDTILLSHCQIEGFSKDTIYFSRFHYNENYDRGSGLNILKFDSVFSINFSQLETLYYSKHRNRQRAVGALCGFFTQTDPYFSLESDPSF